MLNLIYNYIFIPFANVALFILKFLNEKVSYKKKHIKEINSKLISMTKIKTRVWFHASSMGEFEQAKPVIEFIKNNTDYEIICSFYSPTGLNNNKNYDYSDYNCFMPFDSKQNAKEFLSILKPDVAVFVRYDIWFNHLQQLNECKIPTILINAVKPNGKFTDSFWLKSYYKTCFSMFNSIITVNQTQSDYFKALSIDSEVITANDSRLDRIYNVVQTAKQVPILEKKIFADDFVIVAGSTWKEDEIYLSSAVDKLRTASHSIRVIYVPHEPTKDRLKEISSRIEKFVLLSDLMSILENKSNQNFVLDRDIIVDSVGKLLRLYASADIAMIGDGWGKGVHSVSEPAGYGIPLFCGPKIQTMPDAIVLNELGGLFIAKDTDAVYNFINLMLKNKEKYNEISFINRYYIEKAKGASEIIARKIISFL